MKKSSKGKMCMDGLKENWLTLATFVGVLKGKLKMDCPSFCVETSVSLFSILY